MEITSTSTSSLVLTTEQLQPLLSGSHEDISVWECIRVGGRGYYSMLEDDLVTQYSSHPIIHSYGFTQSHGHTINHQVTH